MVGGGVRMDDGVRLMTIGWPTSSTAPRSCERTPWASPRWRTCGSANTWSMVLIGPQGTPARFSSSIQCAAGCRRRIAAIAALSASRFRERSAGVA